MITTPLQEYSIKGKDPDKINQLVLDNLALVKHIIARMEIYLPAGMDKEDLVSIGNWGLIEAAQKFDKSKNVKFQTYAYIRIRGAILDEVRKSSFGGQAVVRKQKQLSDIHNELQSKLGRIPRDEEVAEAMGISTDKLDHLMSETSGAYLLSLDHFTDDDETNRILDQMSGLLSNEENHLEAMIEKEKAELLVRAIEKLGDDEKLVLSLYYEQELSLKEISLIMNLTESRICQIHKKALLNIKSQVANP